MDAKGYPVKNIALIRRIADLINAREHRTVLKKVKAHSGNYGNTLADHYAKLGSEVDLID